MDTTCFTVTWYDKSLQNTTGKIVVGIETVMISLDDLLLAINLILEYVNSYTFVEFSNDTKTMDAVIRNFEVIDEASNKITSEIKKK